MHGGFSHLGAARTAFDGYSGTWFFCGGQAIDLFLGRPVRLRHDIDIGIFRDEQELLRECFPKILITYVKPNGGGVYYSWEQGQMLEPPIHELYLDLPGERLEVLLNDATATHWVYRRNAMVTREVQKAVLQSPYENVPYLAPEIVLLYKSKHMRDRDQIDFDAAAPHLSVDQKAWLKAALDVSYQKDAHPWGAALR
jgi:hypothetical protein